MSKETPQDDPRQRDDWGSLKQTDKPWKGPPEKEQKPSDKTPDLEKWQETSTHMLRRVGKGALFAPCPPFLPNKKLVGTAQARLCPPCKFTPSRPPALSAPPAAPTS